MRHNHSSDWPLVSFIGKIWIFSTSSIFDIRSNSFWFNRKVHFGVAILRPEPKKIKQYFSTLNCCTRLNGQDEPRTIRPSRFFYRQDIIFLYILHVWYSILRILVHSQSSFPFCYLNVWKISTCISGEPSTNPPSTPWYPTSLGRAKELGTHIKSTVSSHGSSIRAQRIRKETLHGNGLFYSSRTNWAHHHLQKSPHGLGEHAPKISARYDKNSKCESTLSEPVPNFPKTKRDKKK